MIRSKIMDDYVKENQLFIDNKTQLFISISRQFKNGVLQHTLTDKGYFLNNDHHVGYITDCYRCIYNNLGTQVFRTEFLNQEISVNGDDNQSLKYAQEFGSLDHKNRLFIEFDEDVLSKAFQKHNTFRIDNSQILKKWIDIDNKEFAESMETIHNLLLAIAIQSIYYPQTSNTFIIQNRKIVKHETSHPYAYDLFRQITMILDNDQKNFLNDKKDISLKIELQLNAGEISIYTDNEILFYFTQPEIGKIILAGNTYKNKLNQTRFCNPFVIAELIKTFYPTIKSIIPFSTTTLDIESFNDLKEAKKMKYYTSFSYH